MLMLAHVSVTVLPEETELTECTLCLPPRAPGATDLLDRDLLIKVDVVGLSNQPAYRFGGQSQQSER